jgi:hypothetical protein
MTASPVLKKEMRLKVTPWKKQDWKLLKKSIQKHFSMRPDSSVNCTHPYIYALANARDKESIYEVPYRLGHKYYVQELKEMVQVVGPSADIYSATLANDRGMTSEERIFVKKIPQVQIEWLPLYLGVLNSPEENEPRMRPDIYMRDPYMAELLRCMHAIEAPHNLEVYCNFLASSLVDHHLSPHFTRIYGVVNCVLPEYQYVLSTEDMEELEEAMPDLAKQAVRRSLSASCCSSDSSSSWQTMSDQEQDEDQDEDKQEHGGEVAPPPATDTDMRLIIVNKEKRQRKSYTSPRLERGRNTYHHYKPTEDKRSSSHNNHEEEEEEEKDSQTDDEGGSSTSAGSRGSGSSGSSWKTSSSDSEEYDLFLDNMPSLLCMTELADFDLGYLYDCAKVDYHTLLSITFQVIMAVLAAVHTFGLKHNDLHTSNVMIKKTKYKYLKYKGDDQCFLVPTHGYIVKIIDWGRGTYAYNGLEGRSMLFEEGNALHGQYVFPHLNGNVSGPKKLGITDNLYTDVVFFSQNMMNLYDDLIGTPLGEFFLSNITTKDGTILDTTRFSWSTYMDVSQQQFSIDPYKLVRHHCFTEFRGGASVEGKHVFTWPLLLDPERHRYPAEATTSSRSSPPPSSPSQPAVASVARGRRGAHRH